MFYISNTDVPDGLSVARAKIGRMLAHALLPPEPHRSVTYALWVTSQDPEGESAALAVLDEVRAAVSSAHPRPGRCLDRLQRRAPALPPAHLPWFWDTVAHRLSGYPGRAAAKAYTLARKAEQDHALPVDPDWRRANVLLCAGAGALPVKELSDHQRWLSDHASPAEAHEEYVRVLTAWAASPGELPADLARRVRVSTRAAGLDGAEEARVLGRLLGSARGKAVPDALLEAATAPLTAHPQDAGVQRALLDLFPESRNDAAAWLRLLLRAGAVDAAGDGRLTPEGGLGAWLGRYTRAYSHRKVPYGGVSRQPMPPELFEIVARCAPVLREEGGPVRLHEDQYHYPGLDADLLDACLAEGIAVEDPGESVRLEFWGERSRRDLRALAADPVFGARLEGTVHAGLRGTGTAITRLPRNAGIAAEVRSRIEALLAALRGGGLAAADEALEELDTLLDRPTATALDGIEGMLAALDLTGPLARALRSGLPEELGWPALEEAMAGYEASETLRVTCTWPVLTVYGRDRAVAVDHAGTRASYSFRVPDDAKATTVHFAGGEFLVGWTAGEGKEATRSAFWSGSPQDVFTPQDTFGMRPWGGLVQGGLGYQFASADGGGRHDGGRVLRPGGHQGIGGIDLQMSDGRDVWSAEVFRGAWTRCEPVTGERGADRTPPDFHRDREVPPGMAEFPDGHTLALLPEGAPGSPLGQDGRLVGCRVLHRTPYSGPSPREFLLESVDGRSARYRSRRPGRRPWGVVRFPEGGEDAVLAGLEDIRCHAAGDNSLLWQVRGFLPDARYGHRATLGEGHTPVPPPAYWHFLTPRDAGSSRALRTVGSDTVGALLAAAVETPRDDTLHTRVSRLLPEVTDPRILAGVVRSAELAADVLRRRRELSHRVSVLRAGPVVDLPADVPDTVLAPALSGLLPDRRPYEAHKPEGHPGTLTAVAADGRRLRGEIDEETRRLAPPSAPAEWQVLLGGIGAVAWRASVETTPEGEREALAALLAVWRTQPFAEPGGVWRTGRAPEEELARSRAAGLLLAGGPARGGTARFLQRAGDPAPARTEEDETVTLTGDDSVRLTRLADLAERHGPLPLTPEAVRLFSRLTGVRRPVATLVLGGLPRREHHDEHQKMLRAAPFRANRTTAAEYDALWHRLGPAGRRAVLAAGVPEDPADLWQRDGMDRAAERMAAVWAGLLGTTPYVDEELAEALESDLGLGAEWARGLSCGRPPVDGRAVVLVGERSGRLALRHTGPDGSVGDRVPDSRPGHLEAAAVIAWALSERPVGHPAATGALQLYEWLRARLDDPGTLVELSAHLPPSVLDGAADFRPYEGVVLPCPQPLWEGREPVEAVLDDGLLVVAVPRGEVFLRPAALADPALVEGVLARCTDRGLTWLRATLEAVRDMFEGLARIVDRAATTPVPAGGYEADPTLSAPDAVAGHARRLGIGADAAALHLQLLTLARPTDRNIRRWNGWTAARHKAAQAELVDAGAVDTDRRPRAGRTVFVPGAWETLDAPHLPLESHKLADHLATVSAKVVRGPFPRLLAPVPLHDLFARAARE